MNVRHVGHFPRVGEASSYRASEEYLWRSLILLPQHLLEFSRRIFTELTRLRLGCGRIGKENAFRLVHRTAN
ncbi:hypothetical protein TNCT_315131 [Trichonephila clavata]|uniref:Uncharacterized protein n=1 Tax=Trichonephila clavata TaxID=2740835 RepID=A0A8X6LEC2_TRICU|nr:hypothetical protein TNCT_315131 [Trichonephila clavata]